MKLIYSLVLVVIGVSVQAQDPSFTQFNRSNMYLNPASVGNLKSWTANYHFRNHWVGAEGSPLVNNIGIQYGFDKVFKGVGVFLINDIVGASGKTDLSVPFAFGFKIKDKIDLNLGAQVSFVQESFDMSGLSPADPSDPSFVESVSSNVDFSIGAEVVFRSLKIGIAGAHLLQPVYDNGLIMAKTPFKISTYINYDLKIGSSVLLSPSVMYAYQGNSYSLVTSATATYKFLKIMGGFRFNNGPVVGLGYWNKRFDIVYTFDIITGDLSSFATGSHEVGVRFRFGKNKEGKFDNAL